MKNIAIPLLMAGSAKAEAKKKAAMLQDYAEPEPILIASSWTGDVCEDSAGDVAQALSDLQAAQGELAELEEGLEELEEAQDEALEGRLEAIDAVIELDAEMEAAVSANNEDIAALIGLKEEMQAANVAASIGEALVASTLIAKNNAAEAYEEAADAYAEYTTDEDDAEELTAGLLFVTNGYAAELEAAEDTESGTGAGSTTARNNADIINSCTNCSDSADAGTPGAGDLVCECNGSYQTGENNIENAAGTEITFPGVYTNSLTTLESNVDNALTTKNTKADELAALNLLEIEYRQISKYLIYAHNQAQSGVYTTGTESDFNQSNDAREYAGGKSDMLTRTALIQEMIDGKDSLSTTLSAETGTENSAMLDWANQMLQLYGRVTHPNTQANTSGDGYNSADSQEFLIQKAASTTGYADWVTDARAMVESLKGYLDRYNVKEIGQDGYESAYLELTNPSDSGSGKCQIPTVSGTVDMAETMTSASATVGGFSATPDYTATWASGADIPATDSDIQNFEANATLTAGNNICALACSSKTHWPTDTNNLPYEYQVASVSDATLTKVNADAADFSNSYCLGFQIDASAGASASDGVKCELYFGVFPTAPNSTDTDEACFERKLSVVAQAYANAEVRTTAGDGSDKWDYFDTAMTNWAAEYEILIDKRLDLDIANDYLTKLGTTTGVDATGTAAAVADSDATYGQVGYKQKWSEGSTGALQLYDDMNNDYTDASSDYTSATNIYNARAVLIASANSDYLLASALWEQNNALISKLTVLTEIATAASDAALTARGDADQASEDAEDDWLDATDAYDGIEDTEEGLAEAQEAAEEAFDEANDAIYGAEGTNTALGEYEAEGSGDLGTLFGLRADALEAYEDLQEAMSDLMGLNEEIDTAKGDVEDALAVHLSAIVACKVENYDAYMETLQLAQQQREDDLDDILALVTEAEEDAPAAGAAGSRCEKALSNGTFRPQRGETTCNEGLCCGAARIPMGEVMMTIETCQAEGTTSYSYVAPRAPMATEPPAAEVVDFVCIEGAKKLAAAASALATAVYMLA